MLKAGYLASFINRQITAISTHLRRGCRKTLCELGGTFRRSPAAVAPAEKGTASQDQARQSGTNDRSRHRFALHFLDNDFHFLDDRRPGGRSDARVQKIIGYSKSNL
jgi:hypothetical protein